VSAKDVLEYGYKESQNDDDDDASWTLVDKKSILESDDVPENVEKMIGFEGKPDPNSGKFLCVLLKTDIVAVMCVYIIYDCHLRWAKCLLLCSLKKNVLLIFFIYMNVIHIICIRLLLCLQ
jgi:hypothetical protein